MTNTITNTDYTSSREVAEMFNKRHDAVLRDIENVKKQLEGMEVDENLRSSIDFKESKYLDKNNQARRQVLMNNQAFIYLSTSYNLTRRKVVLDSITEQQPLQINKVETKGNTEMTITTETETNKDITDNSSVAYEDDGIHMTSRDIAVMFDKRHADVLRDIDVIKKQTEGEEVDENLRSSNNFKESTYTDKSNRQKRQILMTRRGSLSIASSYRTGFREKILDDYERLRENESWNTTRGVGKVANRSFNAVLIEARKDVGKATSSNNFIHNANLVDGLALGVTRASIIKIVGQEYNSIITTRDHATEEQLSALKQLEDFNKDLLFAGVVDYKERKKLVTNFSNKLGLQVDNGKLVLYKALGKVIALEERNALAIENKGE